MELLNDLIFTPGVPGREHFVRKKISDYLEKKNIFDKVYTDKLGSLICVKQPYSSDRVSAKPTRVLVTAHLDQIGFLVSHIRDDGFIRLHPVGAFDPRNLFAAQMIVVNEDGEVFNGVINAEGRPLHTAKPDELSKVPALEKFYLDISLPADEVRRKIQLGNMVVFAPAFSEVGNSVCGTSLDDRAGCWAVISAIEELENHNCEIYVAFTSQEEVGSRGAQTVSQSVCPDIGIACDTTVCNFTPGAATEDYITMPGQGIAIQIADESTISDLDLVKNFENIATDKRIPFQRSLMMGGGQDGARIQLSNDGVKTIVLMLPTKYLHTANEMIHKVDLLAMRDLLRCALETIE